MARLEEYGFEPTPESTAYLDWSEDSTLTKPDFDRLTGAEEAWLKAKFEEDNKREPGNIKGMLLRFQIADGYAYYLVTKTRPLTVQRVIGFMFEYSLPDAYIRGLNKADVEQQLDWNKKAASIFLGRIKR